MSLQTFRTTSKLRNTKENIQAVQHAEVVLTRCEPGPQDQPFENWLNGFADYYVSSASKSTDVAFEGEDKPFAQYQLCTTAKGMFDSIQYAVLTWLDSIIKKQPLAVAMPLPFLPLMQHIAEIQVAKEDLTYKIRMADINLDPFDGFDASLFVEGGYFANKHNMPLVSGLGYVDAPLAMYLTQTEKLMLVDVDFQPGYIQTDQHEFTGNVNGTKAVRNSKIMLAFLTPMLSNTTDKQVLADDDSVTRVKTMQLQYGPDQKGEYAVGALAAQITSMHMDGRIPCVSEIIRTIGPATLPFAWGEIVAKTYESGLQEETLPLLDDQAYVQAIGMAILAYFPLYATTIIQKTFEDFTRNERHNVVRNAAESRIGELTVPGPVSESFLQYRPVLEAREDKNGFTLILTDFDKVDAPKNSKVLLTLLKEERTAGGKTLTTLQKLLILLQRQSFGIRNTVVQAPLVSYDATQHGITPVMCVAYAHDADATAVETVTGSVTNKGLINLHDTDTSLPQDVPSGVRDSRALFRSSSPAELECYGAAAAWYNPPDTNSKIKVSYFKTTPNTTASYDPTTGVFKFGLVKTDSLKTVFRPIMAQQGGAAGQTVEPASALNFLVISQLLHRTQPKQTDITYATKRGEILRSLKHHMEIFPRMYVPSHIYENDVHKAREVGFETIVTVNTTSFWADQTSSAIINPNSSRVNTYLTDAVQKLTVGGGFGFGAILKQLVGPVVKLASKAVGEIGNAIIPGAGDLAEGVIGGIF